jgi:hypothetical protein
VVGGTTVGMGVGVAVADAFCAEGLPDCPRAMTATDAAAARTTAAEAPAIHFIRAFISHVHGC